MRHVQLPVARFAIGARDVPLLHGTVQIVERDHGAVDWEVVLSTLELEPVARAVHDLTLVVISGMDVEGALVRSTYTGPAILVRTHDRGIVFRGNGDLDGFDPALFG